jgi:hypothetical protein
MSLPERVRDVHQFQWGGRQVVVFYEAYQDRIYIDPQAYVHACGDVTGKAMPLSTILESSSLMEFELEDRIHQDCFGEGGVTW